MNFRLNSFFWTFALMQTIEHLIGLVTGTNDEFSMLIGSLIATITLWVFIMPTELLISQHRRYKNMQIGYLRGPSLLPSWEDYSREHRWIHWYDTDGFFADEPTVHIQTRVIICGNCYQWRRIWTGASSESIRWGCPQVPKLYRMTHTLLPWSVNSRPPWIKQVVRGGHND